MYNSKDSYFMDKHLSISMNNPRRMSSSGFEYPKEFSNSQAPRNYSTISEEKVLPTMVNNIQQSVNGAKKGEFVIPNFFSENNINISNQCNSSLRNMMSTSHSNASDPRLNFNDPTSISRFISTPIISNTSLEDSLHNNNFIDSKGFDHSNYSYDSPNMYGNSTVQPNEIHNQYNHKYPEYMYSNDQYYHNLSNNSYMPSYVIYDPRSNSFQNVVLVPQVMPMMNPYMEANEENQYYFQRGNNTRNVQNDTYQDYKNFTTSEAMNLNNQYQDLKSQDFVESNGYLHNSKEQYTYDEQAEIGDDTEDMYQVESESLHSLNRNISGDSDDYSSEDDQLNTVHGDEMLEELQKLSSVFTNVVNVSVMSRNSNVSEPVELLNNINSSRFKKTRIKERTTYWNNKQAIVKDNLVKIIPDEILKIPFIDNDRLNHFENDIFGDQLSNEGNKDKTPDQADCVHSMLRNSVFNEHRLHKHSNCTSQWYRSSATPISLNEFPHLSSNQLHKSNISTRYGNHRKSLQIPIPFPLLVNKFIPLLSPVIPHCNKAFYEQSSSNNMNNIRRKRRWSVSCSRLDSENSNMSNTNSLIQNSESPRDPAKDLLESHQSDESSDRDTMHFINSFESRIDHHLFCLKRSLKAQFDLSLRDIRSEIKSMKNTQIELESQLLFYKNKLDSMEQSIRNCVPENEWKSFGIGIDLES